MATHNHDIKTAKGLYDFLAGLPVDYPIDSIEMIDEKFIVLVDSTGKAIKKVIKDRMIAVFITLPPYDDRLED
jgi:hypothetical protein